MRTPLILLVSLLLVVGCEQGTDGGDPGTTPGDVAGSFGDPDVARIHRRMMDTLAPDRGWERARYIRFDWVVERGDGETTRRSHRWDRESGLYRLESSTEGGTMVALFDLDEPMEGRVWIDGEAVADARRRDLLDRAHAVHVNDTRWLLMPYRWEEPEVRAEYVGRETDEEGRSWDVVRLSFDRGQSVYHAWVSSGSGMMDRWSHTRAEGVEPVVSEWRGWRRVGPIMLASERPLSGREMTIRFENIEVAETVPPDAFRPPTGAVPADTVTGAGGPHEP